MSPLSKESQEELRRSFGPPRVLMIEAQQVKATTPRCHCMGVVDYVYGNWWLCRVCRYWLQGRW